MVSLTSYTSTATLSSVSSTTVLNVGNDELNEKQNILQHKHHKHLINNEVKKAFRELIIPLLLSGFGNMGAGFIFDAVQKWTVFKKYPLINALEPALLGLKGNVEMTLSSRLGTYAHLGHFDDKSKRKEILFGSVALAQCQAAAIGLITPLICILFSYLTGKLEQLSLNGIILIIAISVTTSGTADLILSSTMCFLIFFTHQVLNINVDNISTPIAASIGDVLTMSFLALFSKLLYTISNIIEWITILPIILWFLLIFITAFASYRNEFMNKIIIHGWTPLLLSMIIQNCSGIIMSGFILKFPTMTAFQPVINGFAGNLVAIQSSRLASHLHKTVRLKELPSDDAKLFTSPWTLFFSKKTSESKLALLMLLSCPLQIPYIIILRYITNNSILTLKLFIVYYICSTIQVMLTLYIGYLFVRILWRIGFDPDNSAIPILTALADLLGSIFLAIGFEILKLIGDPNAI